jgi:hypothetical protein
MNSLNEIPRWIYPALGAVCSIAVVVWLVMLWRRRRAQQWVEATIDSIGYEVLRNVVIPNGMEGQIVLQYLLLTERGLLVLDYLERPGAIFGGDQMVEWTAIGKKGRYTFRNPQHALYDRLAALKSLAGNTPVDGRIVFSKRSEFPKGKSTFSLRIDDLPREYTVVDRSRSNVVAAFATVWAHVKKNAQPTATS